MPELEPKPERPLVALFPEAHPLDPAMESASMDSPASASAALLSELKVLPVLCQESVVWVPASALVLVSQASSVQQQKAQASRDFPTVSPLGLSLPEFPFEASLRACPD